MIIITNIGFKFEALFMKYDSENFNASESLRNDQDHVWHHLSQHKPYENKPPMMMVKGEGMRITDSNGKEYLDGVSGAVWTTNVGYGRERIAKAVYDQLCDMNYFANSAGNIPGAEFAKRLVDKMPDMSRVYYSNSGSEANEKVYKMVRQLAVLNTDGKKHKIIYRDRDYHGTTITALSSTGQEERKAQYGPYTPGFVSMPHCCCYRCPFGKTYGDCNIECATALEDVILEEGPDTVGALVLEPITAGGGVIPPPPEYFGIIGQICKKYDVLLHIDEVVCGVGRTGTWFGYQHYDCQPDFVTMAKGVASGYAAISCMVTTDDVFNRFKSNPDDPMSYFRDISTFGGCAGGPAAALENMNIIEEENLLENVTNMGEYAMDKMHEMQEKHEMIGEVRGKGLFLGLELVTDRKTKEPVPESVAAGIAGDCMEQGVIIGRTNRSLPTLNNTLCLAPALIATKDDIDQILGAIDKAMERL
ncbi:MAG: taurine-pyruvate aminotransferase [Saprospiraceae bacterium]